MSSYPAKISSDLLAAEASEDEAFAVVLQLHFARNTHPCTVSGRTTKSYEFKLEPKTNIHTLRVPMSVWLKDNAWMANDLLRKQRSGPIVVLMEPWKTVTPPPLPKAPIPAVEPIQELTEEEIDQKAAALLG